MDTQNLLALKASHLAIKELINKVVHAANNEFKNSDKNAGFKSSVLDFQKENADEVLFHILNHQPTQELLKIEKSVALALYSMYYICFNKGTINNAFPDMPKDKEVSKAKLLVFFWANLMSNLFKHKKVFKEKGYLTEYAFSNQYIDKLEEKVTFIARNVAKEVNIELNEDFFCAEDFIDNTALKDEDLLKFIEASFHKDVPSIQEYFAEAA